MPSSLWRHCPVTMLASLAALLAYASPTLTQWLQLDFAAVAQGQWWRIWTGHLTHYGGQHLFWDLLMFAVLGAACEQKHRLVFVPLVGGMTMGVSMAIFWFCPEVLVYRGLSGVDTGLFVWFLAGQCEECWLARERFAAGLWLVPGVGLIGKLLYEAATGKILFVNAEAFTPLVEAHLAGAALGLMCSILARRIKLPRHGVVRHAAEATREDAVLTLARR